MLWLLAGFTSRAGETLANRKRGRGESTGSREGGTEAQEPRAEGTKSRVRVGRAGAVDHNSQNALRAAPKAVGGELQPTVLATNGTKERDLTRILGGQWQYRGGGCFFTTHLALGKNLILKVVPGRTLAARRPEQEGAAVSRKAALGRSWFSQGARQASPGAWLGAGPGLVVERLVIHHGGRGGRCPSLSNAGAGAGSRVWRLRSASVVHGSYLQGEAGSRGGARRM